MQVRISAPQSNLRPMPRKHDVLALFAPPRLGELARSCLDITLARDTLGWAPGVTIREGLRLTFEASRAAPAR